MRLSSIYPLLILYLISLVNALDDIWAEAQKIMNGMTKRLDPISSPNTQVNNSPLGITFEIPMDYIENNEEMLYNMFWDKNISKEQRVLYDILKRLSDDYNSTDATLILSEMFLLRDFGFPHNKTLAFNYLNKYNKLSNYTNADTIFQQGVMYSTGFFGAIEMDEAKGYLFYQRAARLGDLRAKQALAFKYIQGNNVPRDLEKALLLYREMSDQIKNSYTDYEWNIMFPYLETFNIRLSDFGNGLLDSQLRNMPLSTIRKKSARPDITSSVLTKMSSGNIILQFGNMDETGPFAVNGIEDESDDQLVDLFYSAWDEYKGTYTKTRDCERARIILEMVYESFHNDVRYMDSLQKFFFSKSLDLLGHIYFTGEGLDSSDIKLAEKYLTISINTVEKTSSIRSRANIDMALIEQYYKNNITNALHYYKKVRHISSNNGIVEYQLSKLSEQYPHLKLGDPFSLMQISHNKGYIPAKYEFAKMVEQGLKIKYVPEDVAFMFKRFVERNENILAPYLKNAFGQLLLDNPEVSLWYYTMAAEQGFEMAQVSAAYLMYQIPYKYERLPESTEPREKLAVSYYTRAFKQDNIDAGVIAGDIYYNMGKFSKAAALYQGASLKYSPQAIWNLAYMYEHGLGVSQDFHMAKRFYDQVYENNHSLLLASKLSIFKLYIKSWIQWFNDKSTSNFVGKMITSRASRKVSVLSREVANYFEKFMQGRRYHHRAIVQNDMYLNNYSSFMNEKNTDRDSTNREAFERELSDDEGFGLGDFVSMAIVFIIFLLMFFFRFMVARGDWNVRINGVQVAGRAAGNNNNDDENGDLPPNGARPNQAGNFNVEIFAI